MSETAVKFSATGTNQIYLVQTAGTYLIEAAGAQGGDGAGPGVKGDRVSGMFYLKRGTLLKIVAGSQGLPSAPPHDFGGGGGGASLVWIGSTELPQPIKLMLFARGGKGGAATGAQNTGGTAESGGSDSRDPTPDPGDGDSLGGEMEQVTAETFALEWTRGTGSVPPRTASDKPRAEHGSYNAGAFKANTPEFQMGDGYVSISLVSVPASSSTTKIHPAQASAPTTIDAKELAPAGEPAGTGRGGGEPTGIPPTVSEDTGPEAPSPTTLPQVTSRPGSWAKLLHLPRRPGTK